METATVRAQESRLPPRYYADQGVDPLAPFAVGAYITGAYFFTSSTSFANPAVTLARTLSDTFAGIAPSSMAPYVVAQLVV